MSKRRNSKDGITLLALIITIIVLLVLVGVILSSLFGDNGIIDKAMEAKDKMEKGVVNEILDFSYVDELAKSIAGEIKLTDETLLSAAIRGLQDEGYEVVTVTNAGSTYEGIEITDTAGNEVSEITIESENSVGVRVNLKMTEGTGKTYAKLSGVYYELKVIDGGVKLSEEGQTSIEGERYNLTINPTKEKVATILGDTTITEEQPLVSGAIIALVGITNGTESFEIIVTDEKGTVRDTKTINVTNSSSDVNATSLSITGDGTVLDGGTIKLNAVATPADSTNTIRWSVSSGNDYATVCQHGYVDGLNGTSSTKGAEIKAEAIDSKGRVRATATKLITVSLPTGWDGVTAVTTTRTTTTTSRKRTTTRRTTTTTTTRKTTTVPPTTTTTTTRPPTTTTTTTRPPTTTTTTTTTRISKLTSTKPDTEKMALADLPISTEPSLTFLVQVQGETIKPKAVEDFTSATKPTKLAWRGVDNQTVAIKAQGTTAGVVGYEYRYGKAKNNGGFTFKNYNNVTTDERYCAKGMCRLF